MVMYLQLVSSDPCKTSRNMHFSTVVPLILATVGAFAQRASIYYPIDGSTISPGNQTVEVTRQVRIPDMTTFHTVCSLPSQSSLTGSREVDIVISIAPCPDGICLDPAERLGTTLYVGPFNPQYPTFPYYGNYQPQQNFTVDIPEALAGQKAILSVVHFALLGVRVFFAVWVAALTEGEIRQAQKCCSRSLMLL